MGEDKPRILVVGAGIGGLAAAAALGQAGIETIVFERLDGLIAVGGAFTIASNAMLALRELGLDSALAERGAVIKYFSHRTWRGKELARWPLVDFARDAGAPVVGIGRPEVQDVLLQAVDDSDVRFGWKCIGVVQDESGVTASFENGREERGTALVAADGEQSTVRRLVDETPLRYSGHTTWQGAVTFDEFAPATQTQSYGRGVLFGTRPIGGGKVYWYASRTAPPGTSVPADAKAELLELVRGWHDPIEQLVDATDVKAMLPHLDVYDLPRRDSWGKGRITLLGDAAHPMAPALGQGACQAIEDGVKLARQLARAHGDNIPARLRRYEAERIARTAPIVERARTQDRISHGDTTTERIARSLGLRLAPARAIAKRYKDLFTFEP